MWTDCQAVHLRTELLLLVHATSSGTGTRKGDFSFDKHFLSEDRKPMTIAAFPSALKLFKPKYGNKKLVMEPTWKNLSNIAERFYHSDEAAFQVEST